MIEEDLVAFVLARLDEVERQLDVPDWACTDSVRGEGWGTRGDSCPLCRAYMFEGTESATKDGWRDHMEIAHDSRRVLALNEATRKIANAGRSGFPEMDRYSIGWHDMRVWALTCLAAVWPDHPDHPLRRS